MSCYAPLKGWKIGKTDSGADKYMLTSYGINFIVRNDLRYDNGKIEKYDLPLASISRLKIPRPYIQSDPIPIPCGQCIGCRLDYARSWANRCLLEMQHYDSNMFLTITYDDDHLPCTLGTTPDGEIVVSHPLVKKDWQLFMKRLRKRFPEKKLRFFMAGEYGDSSFRPHYHAIIFGLELNDLEWYKRAGDYDYFTSDLLNSCWTDDNGVLKGYIVVCPATIETAAYTARYCTKKVNSVVSDLYDQLHLTPEFTLMSRKPGIGTQYFEEHQKSLLESDHLFIPTDKKGVRMNIPRYFKHKFDIIFEGDDDYAKMKEDKLWNIIKQAKIREQLLTSQTDLSYLDLLAEQEAVQRSRLKALERSL